MGGPIEIELGNAEPVTIGVGSGRLSFCPSRRYDEATIFSVTYVDGFARGATSIEDELYCIPHGGRLPEFFRGLANCWRGWDGERLWTDGYCALRATHDGVRRVAMEIKLLWGGQAFDMTMSGGVFIEPGQLAAIADELEAMFARPDWANRGANTLTADSIPR